MKKLLLILFILFIGVFLFDLTSAYNLSYDNSSNISIAIYSPLNQTYITNDVLINFTASSPNGISLQWYYNGTANLTYFNATTISLPNGNYNFIFYANDTLGNLDSAKEIFFIDVQNQNESLVDSPYLNPSNGLPYVLDQHLCNATFDYIKTYGQSDFSRLSYFISQQQVDNYYYDTTIVMDYILNWQRFCSDTLNRTLKETEVCDKIYYLIINKDGNYSNSDLLNIKNNLNSTIDVSLSVLQSYAGNYNLKCFPINSKFLPLKKESITNLYVIPNNLTFCSYKIDNSLAGYDFDTSINFFKVYLNPIDSCNKISFYKYFLNLEQDEQGLYSNGIKLWIILTPFIILLLYDIIISHKIFNSLVKRVKR